MVLELVLVTSQITPSPPTPGHVHAIWQGLSSILLVQVNLDTKILKPYFQVPQSKKIKKKKHSRMSLDDSSFSNNMENKEKKIQILKRKIVT